MKKVDGNECGTWDGLITIISGQRAEKIVVCANGDETDKFYSLNDCLTAIGCAEDDTAIAIVESFLHGEIYRYNNYGDKSWYLCGETMGFA